jgi:protein TonB
MYRTDLNTRDKGGAIAAVVAVHAVLLIMLLHLSGRMDLTHPESVLRVFDINEIPPPPPEAPPPPPKTEQQQKPRQTEGAAAPRNIKSKATDVKAPEPRIEMPLPVPMATSKTPNSGTQATQGATVAGPGTGAGGTGTGTGSGGSGSGTGGGGNGGAVSPPHLVTPVLRGRDLPPSMLEQWPRAQTVFLRLRVDSRGFVSECNVDRGTGIPTIDSQLCNVAHDRLRFRPALDRAGQPVAGWFGYAQPPPR